MLANKPLAFFKRHCFNFLGFSSLFLSMCLISTATFAEKVSNNANNTHIRTLAASCAACHGTNGNSHSITPVLAELDPDYFSTQMLAFKQHSRASTVMHHHATGLTDTEISQLAVYFSKQNRATPPPLTTEVLRDKP